LKKPGRANQVSMNLLRGRIKKLNPNFIDPGAPVDSEEASNRLYSMPPHISQNIAKIDNFLARKQMGVMEAFEKIDSDQSGDISEKEFLRMFSAGEFKLPDMDRKTLIEIFKALDHDKSGYVSIMEFVYYFKGSEK